MGFIDIFKRNKDNTPPAIPADIIDIIDAEEDNIIDIDELQNDVKTGSSNDGKKDTIEQRLQFVRNAYTNLSNIIDRIPIPDDFKQKIKNGVLNDVELKELMDSIDSHRPPKILLMGRTGAGKSSLINAICGSYVAFVNDTKSQPTNKNIYPIKDGNRVLMEIFDTRGINESMSLDEKISAEELLTKQLKKFAPDVAVLVLNATHRDSVNEDAKYLKEVIDKYTASGNTKLPVVVVINKCDQLYPDDEKNPEKYSAEKYESIGEVTDFFENIIKNENLKTEAVIPVASYIKWKNKKGEPIRVSAINRLPENEISELQIHDDRRYNIESLRNALLEAIPNIEAKRGLNLALKLDELIHKLAKRMNIIFSGISSVVSATPLPVADLYVLLTLQAVLVSFIAMLSGREINLKTAMEFIFTMGGVAVAGNIFRYTAQQLSKLIPVAGSVISAGIAYSGTFAIGSAAIAYYIDKSDMKTVRKNYEKDKKAIKKSK